MPIPNDSNKIVNEAFFNLNDEKRWCWKKYPSKVIKKANNKKIPQDNKKYPIVSIFYFSQG